MFRQQKKTSHDQIHHWELDLAAMSRCASWSAAHPDLLAREVRSVLDAFPTMIGAVGQPLTEDRCWVEAAEPVMCPDCDELIVFDRGTRCARCGTERLAPHNAVVGFVGRIPALVSSRPLAPSLQRRLDALHRSEPNRAAQWQRALIEVDGRSYLAPRFGLWFGHSWPHADPPVMVWSEYFEMLDLPPDHVYHADGYYRLCLFASWRERPACEVLQSRVVPRLLIDLMLADLQALGRLGAATERLDATLYELYNMVGRPEQTARLQRVYDELVSQ